MGLSKNHAESSTNNTESSKNNTKSSANNINNVNSSSNDLLKPYQNQLAAAFSMALCYISKLQKESNEGFPLRSRILVISASPDVESQYVPIMNSIFAAQKLNVMIDACFLGKDNSSYLQMACSQTSGSYMKPFHRESLVQYLLQHFMLTSELRQILRIVDTQETQNFPAICFETKTPIDQGYVCSLCLSIFSQKKSTCPTCGANFRVLRNAPIEKRRVTKK